MKKSSKGMSASKIAALGAGAAALGSAAYYFLGPKGKEHQKSAKKWTMDARKQVVKKLEKAKSMSEYAYEDIVNDVVKPYMAKGVATAKEVAALTRDLKRDWRKIVAATEKTKSKVNRTVSKVKSKIKK